MKRTPRPSSTSGLTSKGTLLLALIGAGAVLFFLVPRMGAGRAAGPRAKPRAATAELERPARSKLDAVELVPPKPEEPEAPAPKPVAAAASVAAPRNLLPELEEEPIEAPKLTTVRVGGKRDMVSHKELRGPQRDRRREAKWDAELGLKTAEQMKVRGEPSPERWRLTERIGKGKSGLVKGKKR